MDVAASVRPVAAPCLSHVHPSKCGLASIHTVDRHGIYECVPQSVLCHLLRLQVSSPILEQRDVVRRPTALSAPIIERLEVKRHLHLPDRRRSPAQRRGHSHLIPQQLDVGERALLGVPRRY
jgi:hypothetical protein